MRIIWLGLKCNIYIFITGRQRVIWHTETKPWENGTERDLEILALKTEATAKESQQPTEAKRGKKWIIPFSGNTVALLTPWLQPSDAWTSIFVRE